MDRQRWGSTMLVITEVVILVAVIMLGVLSNASAPNIGHNDKQSEQVESENLQVTEGTTSMENLPTEESTQVSEGDWFVSETRETFSAEVEQILASMTTEQKVAQLFITSPEVLTGVDKVTIFGNGSKSALNQYPVAGLVYSQKNFMGNAQAEALIGGAQNHMQTTFATSLFVVIKDDASNYVGYATIQFIEQTKGMLAIPVGSTEDAGILTCNYSDSYEVIAAIKGGMNMIYAPDNFIELYQAVLGAVNEGSISQIRLENAVGRVLSKKSE